MTAPVLDPRRPAPAPGPARRPRPAAAPAGSPVAPGRPQLRVLRPGETVAEADRRRLVQTMVVAGAVLVALCVFGVVVFHVMLTQNQFRLDSLQDQALERQAEYDRLRLQVAELESPDRVVADAQRLGMVPASRITYLAPTVEDTPGGAAPAADPKATAAGTSWSLVKPHLADG